MILNSKTAKLLRRTARRITPGSPDAQRYEPIILKEFLYHDPTLEEPKRMSVGKKCMPIHLRIGSTRAVYQELKRTHKAGGVYETV